MGQSHTDVLASYGLGLTYDDFIIDKCIWVVDLKDGTKVFQDDSRPGHIESSAWKRLGSYVKDFPQNSIAKMRLRFGTHIVELPSNQPFYFYSKGLVQSILQEVGLDFHIVGNRNNSGDVLCSWYIAPELVVERDATRKISECMPGQLIGDLTSLETML
jgi:hypothetical protein